MKTVLLILTALALAATGVIAASHSDIVGTAVNSPNHKTLVKLIKAAGLVEALQKPGPYTVFAPTDAAFARLPKATVESLTKPENKEQLKSILLYHVVKGKVTAKDVMAMKSPTSVATLNGAKIKITHTKYSVNVNRAKVTTPDVMASNGVIHVIDAVLMPPDIVGTAVNSPNHKTLVKLIKAAGLVGALQKPGPYTVFAPTDAAFAKLPKATVESLTKPENKEQLKSILLYHVVKGKVTAKDVMAMKSPTSVATLNGAKIKITHTKHSVNVNKAKVTTPDVMATNGVIHVIDAVLMPPKNN